MKENSNTPKIKIPEEFHSFTEKSLFERCIDCNKFLLEEGTEYFIEKAVKKYSGFDAFDVIFEYAICIDCAEKMRRRMSKESMQRLEQYFSQNIDTDERRRIMESDPFNAGAWTNKCMINGTAKSELNEFQLYAHCNGRYLTSDQMPYLISGEAMNALVHLLSAQTIDELDNFITTHFGPPPELEEELPVKRVVLV